MNTPPDPLQQASQTPPGGYEVPPLQQQTAPTYAAPPPTQPRKGRGWIVATIALAVCLALLACCAAPLFLVLSDLGAPATYRNGIAVIHIDGVIAGTASTDGLIGGGEITPEYVIDRLRAADEDPGIEAIMLRIDSPGGTAAASQEIAMEVARVGKPVIASVGDVAASGAYWIASQCDIIVAAPSSAVGSIGVIMQIPNYEGLLDKLGVEFTVITRGEFKDTGSPFRSLNATELAMIDEDMEYVYQQFIDGVAQGRGLSNAEVTDMATGWAWSAGQAVDKGLVDELGTYQDGLDIAADEAGLDEYEVVDYDEPTLSDVFYELLNSARGLGGIGGPRLDGTDLPPLAR